MPPTRYSAPALASPDPTHPSHASAHHGTALLILLTPRRRLITPRMQTLTTAPPISANQVQRAWPLDPQTFQAQRAACEAIARAAHLKGAPKPAPLQLPQGSGAGGTAAGATAAASESISDASTETSTPMTAGLAACVLTEAEVLEALEGSLIATDDPRLHPSSGACGSRALTDCH